ncbi:hypothetical protein [Nostoc sp.]|uniref:hypothetical protein n=1 Tax=Nostoc sp. TaxID=1180 RepID=UPI002FF915EC
MISANQTPIKMINHHTYWYYKLQATKPIFLTKTDGKVSRYQHLGKAGSQAYLDALEQLLSNVSQ